MVNPIFFSDFCETLQGPALFRGLCANSDVDATGPAAYIGGGPHLPNEVLSFWKE